MLLNKIGRTALLLLALMSVPSLCFAQTSRPSDDPPRPPAPAVEYDPDAWKELVSREGRFSVRMPAEPQLHQQEVDTPLGKLPTYLHVAETGGRSYVVVYTDFPQSTESPAFAGAVIGGARDRMLAADASRKLLGEKEVAVEGYSGREWFVADNQRLYRAKAFLVKGRFYQLLLVAPLGSAFNTGRAGANAADRTGFYEDISKRFFGSFELLPLSATAKGAAQDDPTPGGEPGAAPAEPQAEGEVDRLLKDKSVGGVIGEREASSRPRPASAAKQIVKGGVLNAKASHKPGPVYPPIAKAARVQGTVAVKILLDEEGRVIAAQAESGHPLLQAAAVKAAREARFAPTLLSGQAVKVVGVITYNFVLQ
jgi:TonB family protein